MRRDSTLRRSTSCRLPAARTARNCGTAADPSLCLRQAARALQISYQCYIERQVLWSQQKHKRLARNVALPDFSPEFSQTNTHKRASCCCHRKGQRNDWQGQPAARPGLLLASSPPAMTNPLCPAVLSPFLSLPRAPCSVPEGICWTDRSIHPRTAQQHGNTLHSFKDCSRQWPSRRLQCTAVALLANAAVSLATHDQSQTASISERALSSTLHLPDQANGVSTLPGCRTAGVPAPPAVPGCCHSSNDGNYCALQASA